MTTLGRGGKIVDQALFGAKMGVAMLSVFGLLALGLASIGLYGVIAYSVNLRKREIELRMALGAGQKSVLLLVLSEGMLLVLAGVMIGLVAALVTVRLAGGNVGWRERERPDQRCRSRVCAVGSRGSGLLPSGSAGKPSGSADGTTGGVTERNRYLPS